MAHKWAVHETKPLVEGDWLSDKEVMAWLHHMLYHNEVSKPRAWTAAVTYIVSRVNIMRRYEGNKGTGHTTVGLALRRRHILIVNSGDRKGLHWFVCAMGCRVPVWAFKVHIWEPLPDTFLVWPMLKHLRSKGVSTHARALGFQKEGWSCGYESLHLCDKVVGHHGSLEDVDVILTPLPTGFIKEALRIINAAPSRRMDGRGK